MNNSAMVTQFISNEEHYEKVIERIKNVIFILWVVPIVGRTIFTSELGHTISSVPREDINTPKPTGTIEWE